MVNIEQSRATATLFPRTTALLDYIAENQPALRDDISRLIEVQVFDPEATAAVLQTHAENWKLPAIVHDVINYERAAISVLAAPKPAIPRVDRITPVICRRWTAITAKFPIHVLNFGRASVGTPYAFALRMDSYNYILAQDMNDEKLVELIEVPDAALLSMLARNEGLEPILQATDNIARRIAILHSLSERRALSWAHPSNSGI